MARYLIILILCCCGLTYAGTPPVVPGLDSRAPIGAYLDNKVPSSAAVGMPDLLSQTGAFTDTVTRTPRPGLVPYALNSPLWTDGAVKSRFIALPFDGTVGSTGSPTIGFSPTGSWAFPNGTVIVKNFDMVVDEQINAIKPIRRLETRLLVRNDDGTLRGATYKWNAQETDAVRVDDAAGLNETLTITQADGVSTRTQNYTYPGPGQCLVCHNANAGMVLGIRTAQLNGNHDYTQPDTSVRTDNQLHTFSSLGMFNTPLPDTASYPQYTRMVAVGDTIATLENRVRSYLSSNCGHCHQPGGIGPIFDARYDTPVLAQNIFSPESAVYGALIRKHLATSRLFVRDSITVVDPLMLPFPGPMPPIARNIPDPALLAIYGELVNYAYDIFSVMATSRTQVRVQFNRAVETSSAIDIANYAIDYGARILQATQDTDPSVVLLTTDPLPALPPMAANFTLTVNRVNEAAAPQNPIWPNTVATFGAPPPVAPGAPAITITQAGDGQVTLSFTAPAYNGGAAITSYTASCIPGPITASNGGSLSITVSGLTNGIPYDCTVAATNAAGLTGPASAPPRTVTPIAPPIPVLLSAASIKTHGAVGPFELPIAAVANINAAVTVEPRIIGSGHTIVFRFDIPISSPGNVTLAQSLPAGGAMATAAASSNPNEIIVTLTGVSDNQRVAISLANINNLPGATANAFVGFLVGDVDNSRSVTPGDVSSVKARSGQTTVAANFRFDLNASGTINASDVAAVKTRSVRNLSM